MTRLNDSNQRKRCPDCINGRAVPCAVGCRDWDECCDKKLGYPCERCGGTGFLLEEGGPLREGVPWKE